MTILSEGQVEKLGSENSILKLKFGEKKINDEIGKCDHEKAFEVITRALLQNNVVDQLSKIKVVGHRVVHGGVSFSKPVIVDNNVKQTIGSLTFLAPLHNPANLTGIINAEQTFPDAKQIAVFDTAFHTTIPEFAHRYALPEQYYRQHHIRVYGFHGTSHKYVSEKWYALNNRNRGKIITLHLGNGCSMAAIKDGCCIDTSLGFSPTAGLIMGTRSGDIDPMIIPYLIEKLNMSSSEVTDLLNKKSGMLGISGKSDLREIIQGAELGIKEDKLALEMNAYRIKKYIGAYVAAMNGLDALVFTAGIGENSAYFRASICSDMSCFGIALDKEINKNFKGLELRIDDPSSKIGVWVIPTNEELEIAQQAYRLIT
jgi:acetate kinase